MAQLKSADRDALVTFSPTVRGLVGRVTGLLEADAAEAAAMAGEADAFRHRVSGVRVLAALRAGRSGEAGLNQNLLDATRPRRPRRGPPAPGPPAARCW